MLVYVTRNVRVRFICCWIKASGRLQTVLLTGVLWHQNEHAREYQFVTGRTEPHLLFFFFGKRVCVNWLWRLFGYVSTRLSWHFRRSAGASFLLRVPVAWIWQDIQRRRVLRTWYSSEHNRRICWVARSKVGIWEMSCDRMHGSE
jgi:hypothetical protein